MAAPAPDDAWLDRPVYVSGLMKTGSTLLLALLDGHSEVLAYPDEPSFERIIHREYVDGAHLTRDWLYGTVNPLHYGPTLAREGHLPAGHRLKSWTPVRADFRPTGDLEGMRRSIRLRGLSEADQREAIDLEAYLVLLQQRLDQDPSPSKRDVVVETMRALRDSLRQPVEPEHWLFKHPLSRYRDTSFQWFFSAFPEGRVVVLMRDPRAYVHSLEEHQSERALRGAGRVRRSMSFVRRLSELERDYAGFAALPGRYGSDRVRLAYYEDLVHDTRAATADIASWIGVSFEETLLQPTKLGRPVLVPTATQAEAGTVYTASAERWRVELSKTRQVLVEVAVDDYLSAHRDRYVPVSPARLRTTLRPALVPSLWAARRLAPTSRPVLRDSAAT